jgi:hypothetical protein
MVSAAPTLSSIGTSQSFLLPRLISLDVRVQEGNKQQATSLDVERQPRPVGGGTTGSGRGRRRCTWTEEELAWKGQT